MYVRYINTHTHTYHRVQIANRDTTHSHSCDMTEANG